MTDAVKQALYGLLVAVLAAAAGGGGTYLATAPKGADAALAKAIPQLTMFENMTGLCIKIDKAPGQPAAAPVAKP